MNTLLFSASQRILQTLNKIVALPFQSHTLHNASLVPREWWPGNEANTLVPTS